MTPHPLARPLTDLEQFVLDNYPLDKATGYPIGPKGRPIAGSPNTAGYRQFGLKFEGKQRRFLMHRYRFLVEHGWLPKYLDHRDRNPENCEPSNLRPVTWEENFQNRPKPHRTTPAKSRFKGVSFRFVKDGSKRWFAYYQQTPLGMFPSEMAAARAVDLAAALYWSDQPELPFYNFGGISPELEQR